MSIKIIIDNNFFDNFRNGLDDISRRKIKKALRSKRVLLYITNELIVELLGLYDTSRKDLLKEYATFLLEIDNWQCFNAWNKIILAELGIEPSERIFMSVAHTLILKKVLSDISRGEYSGHIPSLLNDIQADKTENFESYQNSKRDTSNYPAFQRLQNSGKKVSFNDFYSLIEANKTAEQLRLLFNRAGKGISQEQIDKLTLDKERVPWFFTYQRVEWGMFYLQNFGNRTVELGDSYDVRQLVYLMKADHFVSEDKKLKALSEIVFGSNREKVLTMRQLITKISTI